MLVKRAPNAHRSWSALRSAHFNRAPLVVPSRKYTTQSPAPRSANGSVFFFSFSPGMITNRYPAHPAKLSLWGRGIAYHPFNRIISPATVCPATIRENGKTPLPPCDSVLAAIQNASPCRPLVVVSVLAFASKI